MDLFRLTAREMLDGMAAGKFTSRQIVQSCFDRIEALEPTLHALLFINKTQALADADAADAARQAGKPLGLLHGVPVILKDNLCTNDMPTTCASKMLEHYVPPYDATVVKLLRQAGAVFLGKANMDEFAMGGSTENSAFGPTYNPWDPSRVPGGSSGGSAAAVAVGYAPLALGSDTGGSIRQPASFCGLFGMKPTYGQVSRYGLGAYASSLDQVGGFARTPEDLSLLLTVLCQFDPYDSTSAKRPAPDLSIRRPENLKGHKIGVLSLPEDMASSIDVQVRSTLSDARKHLADLGADVVDVSLPVTMKYGLACYYVLAPAEASANLARYDGVRYGSAAVGASSLIDLYTRTRGRFFGPEVKRRILTGTYVLSSGFYDAYYLTAQKVRQKLKEEFAQAFSSVEALLLPTSPTPAYRIGEVTDPVAMYMADLFTIPVNLAGLPGVTYTARFTDNGLPVGLQLVGAQWTDGKLLNLAALLGSEHENVIAEGKVRS